MERKNATFVIVHGAGSFGHHTAKEFGLEGKSEAPESLTTGRDLSDEQRRYDMRGLAETRISVQTLNRVVVSSLLDHGVNAVGISPCFGNGMEAHSGDGESLSSVVKSTLKAGLVPVLHGDACLWGEQGVGILSGDVLMELIGQAGFVTHSIFLTDVDGVFTADPRTDSSARLIRQIEVDPTTSDVVISLPAINVSGSSHEHDVTGGLKTKLASSAKIASKTNVTIVKCTSPSAEQAIRRRSDIDVATVLFAKRE